MVLSVRKPVLVPGTLFNSFYPSKLLITACANINSTLLHSDRLLHERTRFLSSLLPVELGERQVGRQVEEHVEAQQDGDDLGDALRQLPVPVTVTGYSRLTGPQSEGWLLGHASHLCRKTQTNRCSSPNTTLLESKPSQYLSTSAPVVVTWQVKPAWYACSASFGSVATCMHPAAGFYNDSL